MFSLKSKLVNILVIVCLLRNLRKCWGKNKAPSQSWGIANDHALRIVNGKPAFPGDVPYQVGFRIRVQFATGDSIYMTFCGGTIITPLKTITAAHCFESNTMSDCCNPGRVPKQVIQGKFAVAGTILSFGEYRSDDSKEEGQWRRIRSAYHPRKYDFPLHDICVVKLTQPFIFDDYVAPIPFATVRMQYTGSCLASGYGLLSREGDPEVMAATLYKTSLPIESDKLCGKTLTSDFICVRNTESDTSKGDSGGPLVCKNTGDPMEGKGGILVGVVSGALIYEGRLISFLTRVTSYNSFLKKHINSSVSYGPSSMVQISSLFCLLYYWKH